MITSFVDFLISFVILASKPECAILRLPRYSVPFLVLAPELMLTEVANALWRLQRAGQLEVDGLQRRLSRVGGCY